MDHGSGGATGAELISAAAEAARLRPDLRPAIEGQIGVLLDMVEGGGSGQAEVDDALIRLGALLKEAGIEPPGLVG